MESLWSSLFSTLDSLVLMRCISALGLRACRRCRELLRDLLDLLYFGSGLLSTGVNDLLLVDRSIAAPRFSRVFGVIGHLDT